MLLCSNKHSDDRDPQRTTLWVARSLNCFSCLRCLGPAPEADVFGLGCGLDIEISKHSTGISKVQQTLKTTVLKGFIKFSYCVISSPFAHSPLPVHPFPSNSGPNIQMMVGSGLALHPFFPTSEEWNVVKEKLRQPGFGMNKQKMFSGVIWEGGRLKQACTWVWGPENSDLLSWILAGPDDQAASKDSSFSVYGMTQLVEMQERPPVAKYRCEIFSKEHHEELRSTVVSI